MKLFTYLAAVATVVAVLSAAPAYATTIQYMVVGASLSTDVDCAQIIKGDSSIWEADPVLAAELGRRCIEASHPVVAVSAPVVVTAPAVLGDQTVKILPKTGSSEAADGGILVTIAVLATMATFRRAPSVDFIPQNR